MFSSHIPVPFNSKHLPSPYPRMSVAVLETRNRLMGFGYVDEWKGDYVQWMLAHFTVSQCFGEKKVFFKNYKI